MDAFNTRWSAFFDDADEDLDEREAFNELLDEVDSLSDAMTENDHEGGPGMSSAFASLRVSNSTGSTWLDWHESQPMQPLLLRSQQARRASGVNEMHSPARGDGAVVPKRRHRNA